MAVGSAYLYSDETGTHSGGRYFVVAGAVLGKHQKWTADQIAHAERVSDKGRQDWKGTKNVKQRIRYIEEVLKIANLRGAVFFATYPNNDRKYFDCTVDALTRAVIQFGQDRKTLIRHQGFNYKTREKLKAALTETGRDYEIQTGSEKRAEIRLADALCGYLGLVLFNQDERNRNYYPPVPDWFLDLTNEAPV